MQNPPTPADPDFEALVRASFARQPFMALLRAELVSVEPGRVTVALAARPELTQQHGYLHAGATWSIADNAGGYAARSLMPAHRSVLTVEMKINLLAPAEGERLIAVGQVERAGRTLTVCRSDVWAETAGARRHVAIATGTFMAVATGPDA